MTIDKKYRYSFCILRFALCIFLFFPPWGGSRWLSLKEAISGGFLGAGITFIRDEAGDSEFGITQMNISLSSSKHFDSYHLVSAGLQGGVAQRSVSPEKLQWGSQWNGNRYDETIAPDEPLFSENFSFADFSGGLLWTFNNERNTKVHAGISALHLNRPKQYFYTNYKNLYSKIVFLGSGEFLISGSRTSLLPSLLTVKEGPSKEIITGLMVRQNFAGGEGDEAGSETSVSGGIYSRLSDAFILAGQIQYRNFSFGIAYDVNVSGLSVASKGRGGLEIAITYIPGAKSNRGEDVPRVKF
ncbi:MAG: type IX secretion system membrane protein PorP/SprF [Bacteroidetes bacterium]|nr:type IX secretion system membrane protein PorP/SprF [Bacteroidota bacterium]